MLCTLNPSPTLNLLTLTPNLDDLGSGSRRSRSRSGIKFGGQCQVRVKVGGQGRVSRLGDEAPGLRSGMVNVGGQGQGVKVEESQGRGVKDEGSRLGCQGQGLNVVGQRRGSTSGEGQGQLGQSRGRGSRTGGWVQGGGRVNWREVRDKKRMFLSRTHDLIPYSIPIHSIPIHSIPCFTICPCGVVEFWLCM